MIAVGQVDVDWRECEYYLYFYMVWIVKWFYLDTWIILISLYFYSPTTLGVKVESGGHIVSVWVWVIFAMCVWYDVWLEL